MEFLIYFTWFCLFTFITSLGKKHCFFPLGLTTPPSFSVDIVLSGGTAGGGGGHVTQAWPTGRKSQWKDSDASQLMRVTPGFFVGITEKDVHVFSALGLEHKPFCHCVNKAAWEWRWHSDKQTQRGRQVLMIFCLCIQLCLNPIYPLKFTLKLHSL